MPDLDRWRTTWRGLGGDAGDDLYSALIARYSEPHRKYHTVQHLDECFAMFDEAKGVAEHPYEIELALWYHDAVYDVRSQDSEERSAALARSVATQAALPEEVIGRVSGLILATKHDAAPAFPDAALIADVDLSILGAPAQRFDEYERQIREEYSWVPGFLLGMKRRQIIDTLLARRPLYNTAHFRERYEAAAKANLKRSLQR